MITKEQKVRYDMYKSNKMILLQKVKKNQNLISRDQQLQLNYFNNPYLLLETDRQILDRLSDIFACASDIGANGKIIFTPMTENNNKFMQLFTDTFIEASFRKIFNLGPNKESINQINSYYEGGKPPVGFNMFKGISEDPKGNTLYRFSKKEYIEDMHKNGKFRIAPASFYSKGSHLKAVKDLETQRIYRVNAVPDILQGKTSFEFGGIEAPVSNGYLTLNFTISNYYLFCTSYEINRKLPTDFEADSVLVIEDKDEFLRRCKKKLEERYPNWEFIEGNVNYYDPHTDLPPSDQSFEFTKHFSFNYQKEHRFILKNRFHKKHVDLKEIYLELGSLEDISYVINS